MKRWYAVHCHANAEATARSNLRRQNYETYLPVYRKTRRHARKVDQVARPLFPGYLFVRLDLDVEGWRPIRSSVGVGHIVCRGDRPAAIPEGIVETILARENAEGFVELDETPAFRRGDSVRLTEGPLADRIGLFEGIADDQRVIILLELLGRSVQIRVAMDTVSAAA